MRLAIAVLAATVTTTPGQLLKQLLATPWTAASLPAKLAVIAAGHVPVSPQGKRYHAVGEIAFELKGAGARAPYVFFEAFPTAADASGDLRHPHLNAGDHTHGSVAGVAGSLEISSTDKNGGAVTLDAAARGNVIVLAIAPTPAIAAALLKAGIAHLKTFAGPTA